MFGPYRVCEPLGIGGMATVDRAEIEIDGEKFEVALKRLDPTLAKDRTFVRRFIDEARLGQQLRHANIARTHEVGCIDNTHFIAFEYVPGVTVQRLFEHAVATRPPPVPITLRVITQVARALGYAHGLRDEHGVLVGLIHRDVAPSNIIVANTGSTKLIDFGIAKSSIGHVRTLVGAVVGKLGYVAPEYLRTGKLDARADVYSLGVVAYELLTARRLFEADQIDAAEAQRAARIAPPSSLNRAVPPALDNIVLAALAPDPRRRTQSALDLYTALDNLALDHALSTTDSEVAIWLRGELADMPPPQPTIQSFSDIAMDIDSGVEQAFAEVRAPTASDE